jgi:mRNA interferase RelE/StbE
MIIQFDKSFERSLRHVHDPRTLQRLKRIIIQLENSSSLSNFSNIKKLTGFSDYYRIRVGDYRIGFEVIEKATIKFIVIAHRKDIYNLFP